VIGVLFIAIYALTKNWKLGAVLAVVLEMSVSDAYTKQLMPPAFLMLTENLRKSEQGRYVLFFYVNWLLFGVMAGYAIAVESGWP
jgi:hypothetical protein